MIKLKICGIPAKTGGIIKYDLRGPFVDDPSRVALGSYVALSKPEAKRLATALNVKVPRVGYAVQLCGEQYLENQAGSFQVNRRATGEFRGTKVKRR